jgi:hypothetical protein
MPQSELLKTRPISEVVEDRTDFSLVLGGPLYQLYLRTRLARPPLDLMRRRIIGLSLICWMPPLLLALLQGHLFGGVSVPFLLDVGAHTRFLGALPLLIGAELFVHVRIRLIAQQFLERGIIAKDDRSRFEDLVTSTMRLRNSILVEVLLLLLALSGHWVVSEFLTLQVDTWYGVKTAGTTHFTAAGYWYVLVSLPILRFIILRWYYRLFLWYWFLWHVRRLPLHLNLFHPDRAGGLGFLAGSVYAFGPVLAAQTVVLAGVMGQQIWHSGATLPSFKMEIVGVVIFLMLLVLTPLGFFMAQLDRAGRTARQEYGLLASHYVDDFHNKWIQSHKPDGERLLGTPDIQSLADLGNGYSVVSDMHILPFGKNTVVHLAIIITLPLLPLTLTMFPLEKIIDGFVKAMLG